MTKSTKNKITKITPLLCVIIYLTVGTVFNTWHPTWLIFLAIPIVSSLVYTKALNNLFTLTVIAIYVGIGVVYGVWHPTWIMFLLIPIFDILFPKNRKFKNE